MPHPPASPLYPLAVKEKQRALRDGFSTPLALRVHRSLCWLIRAERETDDTDSRPSGTTITACPAVRTGWRSWTAFVHGGATWHSTVNRDQVRDGAAILTCLLPIFVDLTMDHPAHEWPMPHYRVLE